MQYIIGAGALGSLFTAYLLKAGYEVTLIEESHERIQHIRTHGIEVQGFRGEFHVAAPRLLSLADFLHSGVAPDFLFLCTSSQVLSTLVPGLAAAFPQTVIIPFTGGLSSFRVREIAGADRCVGAVANLECRLSESGAVETNFHNFIWLGEFDTHHSERLDALQQILSYVAPTFLTRVIEGMIWSKAIYSVEVILSALVDALPRDVFDKPVYRRLAAAFVRENIALAKAYGVTPIAFDFFDPNLYESENAKQGAVTDIWIRNAWIRHEQFRVGLANQFPSHVGLTWLLSPQNRTEEASSLLNDLKNAADRLGHPTPLTDALSEIHQAIKTEAQLPGWSNLNALELKRVELVIQVPFPEL